MGRLVPLLVALAAVGCAAPTPELVWVAAPDFEAGLEVWTDAAPDGGFPVGAWISLHAARSTGPWQQVRVEDETPAFANHKNLVLVVEPDLRGNPDLLTAA